MVMFLDKNDIYQYTIYIYLVLVYLLSGTKNKWWVVSGWPFFFLFIADILKIMYSICE